MHGRQSWAHWFIVSSSQSFPNTPSCFLCWLLIAKITVLSAHPAGDWNCRTASKNVTKKVYKSQHWTISFHNTKIPSRVLGYLQHFHTRIAHNSDFATGHLWVLCWDPEGKKALCPRRLTWHPTLPSGQSRDTARTPSIIWKEVFLPRYPVPGREPPNASTGQRVLRSCAESLRPGSSCPAVRRLRAVPVRGAAPSGRVPLSAARRAAPSAGAVLRCYGRAADTRCHFAPTRSQSRSRGGCPSFL